MQNVRLPVVQSVVRDAKENRENMNMAARNPGGQKEECKIVEKKALGTRLQVNQNGRSQLWRPLRNSYPGFPCYRPKVYIWVSDTFAYFAP